MHPKHTHTHTHTPRTNAHTHTHTRSAGHLRATIDKLGLLSWIVKRSRHFVSVYVKRRKNWKCKNIFETRLVKESFKIQIRREGIIIHILWQSWAAEEWAVHSLAAVHSPAAVHAPKFRYNYTLQIRLPAVKCCFLNLKDHFRLFSNF